LNLILIEEQKSVDFNNYPTKTAITNVIAGRRLQMALATDDEARYRPSKYKF
jgi:hypothetical protein